MSNATNHISSSRSFIQKGNHFESVLVSFKTKYLKVNKDCNDGIFNLKKYFHLKVSVFTKYFEISISKKNKKAVLKICLWSNLVVTVHATARVLMDLQVLQLNTQRR